MSGLTKVEMEFCERVPYELGRIADSLEKIAGIKEPKTEVPKPAKEEHPTDSSFDVLAVTSVTVRCIFNYSPTFLRTKALVDVVLNDQLQLRGLRVMEGDQGLYVAYPPDTFYKDEDCDIIYNPVTRQLKEHIENCVLEKYNDITK